jgi:hypothetical protein
MSMRLFPRSIRNERGSWGLIGLLLSLVIGLAMVYMFIGPQMKSSMGAKTTPGRAMEEANGVKCQSNLTQIRTAITMYRQEHESNPASIANIQVGTADPDFFKCPVGHEAYVYDPTAGTIHCPHPGHEKY